jgi:RND family efflux transporter MFP subunit
MILTVAFMISCNSNNSIPETPDEIKKQINEYRSEIKKITRKIEKLNKKLSLIETGEKNTATVKVNSIVVKPEVFRHYFTATGSVEAINEAYVSPEINGQIESMYVEEGDKVDKGEVMAKLKTDIIEKNIEEVKINLKLAKITFEKQQELWNKKIGSEIQYLQTKNNYESLKTRLETLMTQYNLAFIKSPITGYVDNVSQKTGELAIPGKVMFHIVNLDNLKIKAKVSEVYLPSIKQGDKLRILFPAFADISINSIIYRIGQVINKSDRTFDVESRINNINNKIKPNLLATLVINDYTRPEAITVPSHIIREDLKGFYLYVIEDVNGTAKAVKRYIETGKSYKDKTEIIKGLVAGERVITDGYNNVSDGVDVVYQ